MIRFIGGDCRERLKDLPDSSVQCVVTSPPYFGLRDYGTADWSGGDPACDHKKPGTKVSAASTLRSDGRDHLGPYDGEKAVTVAFPFKDACGKCGAVRTGSQIGLEASPSAYVAEMVAVFSAVWRVLRDDGTVWLNLGDSYANDTKWGGSSSGKHVRDLHGDTGIGRRRHCTGLKSKDLMMIPARVAIALQDDGWYLRSDVIWAKPNPMPENVTDRPTSAYEHVFLLTKRASYFYDAEAIKEEGTIPAGTRAAKGSNVRSELKDVNSRPPEYWEYNGSRNARNVWTIATRPFAEAHFATFPPKLVETCVKAGTSERGACRACGAPWTRVIGAKVATGGRGSGNKERKVATDGERSRTNTHIWGRRSLGSRPRRRLWVGIRPAIVLLPTRFRASFWTRSAALAPRRWLLTYGTMARDRLVKDAGMFAEFGP